MHYTVDELIRHGVDVPTREGVYVARTVPLDHIAEEGVVLHPGTRIGGAHTVLAPGARVGTHGPARLVDVALGRDVEVASGSLESCTLLAGAKTGPGAHVRAGTLLEEHASTGHAVGLKQTVLLSFATLGSQINFCDALLAGGRSSHDHSEVGSGFIHFNFTPFGRRGDKATASLFGEVTRGVRLDQNRVFVGGSGGVVGPVRVGFGTVLGAGCVYRRDYGEDLLVVGEHLEPRVMPFDPMAVRHVTRKIRRSLHYIAQLFALRAWYTDVRMAHVATNLDDLLLESAVARLDEGVAERVRQVDRLLESADSSADVQAGWASVRARLGSSFGVGPIALASRDAVTRSRRASDETHLAWAKSLTPATQDQVTSWLGAIVAEIDGLMP